MESVACDLKRKLKFCKKNILLTGEPGIGKTTLIMKIVDLLRERGMTYQGFYTKEQRVKGKREGFTIHTLPDMQTAYLAHISIDSKHFVGKYAVSIDNINHLAVPSIKLASPSTKHIVIIDEIGKMECISEDFQE